MKLKILFFPSVVLLVIILSIWVIWPMWFDEKDGIKQVEKELSIKEKEYSTILSKQDNIKKLEALLQENKNNEVFASEYLPASQNKEWIINDLNRISSASQVALVSISFNEQSSSGRRTISTSEKELAISSSTAGSEQTLAKAGLASSNSGGGSTAMATFSNISVSGNYSKIRSFLNRLYSMPMLSNVISIDIRREALDIGDESGVVVVQTDPVLILNAKLAFGSLDNVIISSIKDNLSDPIFTAKENELDFAGIEKARKITIKNEGISSESPGKINPFTH